MSKTEAAEEKMADDYKGSAGVDTEHLMKELGQFKRFHIYNYCMIVITVFVAALYATNYVFLAGDVHYRLFWILIFKCIFLNYLLHYTYSEL